MRKSVVTFLMALVIVACSDPSTPDGPALDIIAGANVSDTISALPTQALVVRVIDDNDRPTAGIEVRFEAGGVAGMAIGAAGGTGFSNVVGAVTDAQGRAVVRVQFGYRTGTGHVAVAVPLFNLTDTARYTVLPGKPVAIGLSPRDTVVVVGSSFAYRGTLVDRAGNGIDAPGTFSSNSSAVQVSPSGLVTGVDFGTATVTATATFNGVTQSTTGRVAVIPAGTIAWTLHPENLAFGTLSEVRRTVPAGGGAASWEPGKGRVVASRSGALLIVDTLGNVLPLQTLGFTGVTWPEWSTDGWIYFHGYQGFSTAIGRVRPDGTGIQTIAGTAGAQMPTLSPDANSVAYAAGAGLVIQNLTTGATRALLNTNGALTPRWSNDGQWIAFTVGQFGDLMVVRPDGTQLQRVATSIHAGLTWSPDSRWILARGGSTATLVDMTTRSVLQILGVNFGEYPGWKR